MKFEIGHKVYCHHYDSEGTITDIRPTEEYPIYVSFESGNADTYTKSGKRLKSADKYLELIPGAGSTSKKQSESLNFEYIVGLGKVFTLSCGTRILKTIENTHIILPQIPDL